MIEKKRYKNDGRIRKWVIQINAEIRNNCNIEMCNVADPIQSYNKKGQFLNSHLNLVWGFSLICQINN